MLDSLLKPHALPEDYNIRRIDCIFMFHPGETLDLMDFEGPGCIRHFFITMNPQELRDVILRMYWDGEAEPSVECPISDFFGIGHDLNQSDLNCLLFYTAPRHGFNCYIPMPFSKSARITITNEGEKLKGVHHTIDFHSYDEEIAVPWRFHAAWRRVMPAYRRGAGLTLLEAVGDGKLLGMIYHVVKRDSDDRWSHGGADQLFIDGETTKPKYIYGTGGENYAHHAWGLYPRGGAYAGAHHVHPVPQVKRAEGQYAFEPHAFEQHDGGHYSMYRFYVPDPVRFKSSIRFTFGTCENEISSTVYWYQQEPHQMFVGLPEKKVRHYGERLAPEADLKPLAYFQTVPVAVLGPVLEDENNPWNPDQPLALDQQYATNLKRPFADVIHPPYDIRWRRSQFRGGFFEMAAIHRPKTALRPRGMWNYRSLPKGTTSYNLIRVVSPVAQETTLRLGFEDEVKLWANGERIAEFNLPEPQPWTTRDIPVTLKAGVNEIIFGCTQWRMGVWSAWTIYAQFLNADGTLMDGLTYEDFEGMDPTPERWREQWPPDGIVESDNYRDPLMIT